jgi:Tfp pilus assembly protein FimV
MTTTSPKAAKSKVPTPVEALKHKDKRANIPTEELREFTVDPGDTLKRVASVSVGR